MPNKTNKGMYTATELSKYTYCNYSWYYEKTYTTKELRRLSTNINIEGYKSTNDNYARGRKFHENYYKNHKKSEFIKIILIAVIIMLIYMVISKNGLKFNKSNNSNNNNVNTYIL